MSVYVIAEAGSCHEEDYTKAAGLVRTANACGADAVKFQYWSSPSRMRERRRVEDVGAYDKGSLRVGWLEGLSLYARECSLDFMCTCYLPEDIATVAPYVDKFKVSSFEAEDHEFIAAHIPYEKHIIISTGMQDGAWGGGRFEYLMEKAGRFVPVSFLHCVSAYPTPIGQASLIQFGGCESCDTDMEGYSDHTCNVLTGAVAVGAGAKILEVHFRLDSTLKTCPDYPVSLSPSELTTYISNVRLAERLLGDGIKGPQECERENMKHRVMG